MPIQLQNHRTSNAKLLSIGSNAPGKHKLHTAASLQQKQKNNLKVRKNDQGGGNTGGKATIMKRMFANPTNATPNLPDEIPDRDCSKQSNQRRQHRRRHSIGSSSTSTATTTATTDSLSCASLRSSTGTHRLGVEQEVFMDNSSNGITSPLTSSSNTSVRRIISLNDIMSLADTIVPDLTNTTNDDDDDDDDEVGLDLFSSDDPMELGATSAHAAAATTISPPRRNRRTSKSPMRRISLDDASSDDHPPATDDKDGIDLRRSRRRRSNNNTTTGRKGSSKSPLRSILGSSSAHTAAEGKRRSRTSKSPMRRISLNDVIGMEDASCSEHMSSSAASHTGGGTTTRRNNKASKSPMRRLLGTSFDDDRSA